MDRSDWSAHCDAAAGGSRPAVRVDQPPPADDFDGAGCVSGGRVWRRGAPLACGRAGFARNDSDCGKPVLDVAGCRDHAPEKSGECAVEGGAASGAQSGKSYDAPTGGRVRAGAWVEEESGEEVEARHGGAEQGRVYPCSSAWLHRSFASLRMTGRICGRRSLLRWSISFRILFVMNKVVANADEAIRDVGDGAVIMIGGFGLCGIPENLIRALVRKGSKNLTTISNNVGVDGLGNGLLLAAGQIVRHIGTYVGENKLLEEMVLTGKIHLDLVPQGTFSERIRAGGAGIPAFFTPTGVGTMVADGKETREFDGRTYVMEHGLKADFAFVKAWKGDRMGNLVYRKTARNFNPIMATAAKVTIAEVEHLVEVGELDGDSIHTPSVYVKRIFQGELYERRIERRTVRRVMG